MRSAASGTGEGENGKNWGLLIAIDGRHGASGAFIDGDGQCHEK